MHNQYEISEKWIKASIVGTIWAASEIVLGSFLHNLRIPFSSNILTAIGVVILISTSYIWTDKGLFWRAGLICALMKTMSPSAVIFGPMIAIFSQAILLEISVRIFGRTILGFVLGAMLAMSWNLFHKIMNFIIIYGFNIVEVYADLLKYAQKQLNIMVDLVWSPILVLLAIYCALGVISAIIGIRIGRKILKEPADNRTTNFNRNSGEQPNKTPFNYSIAWLFANLILMVTSLVLINFTAWTIWSSFITVIVAIWIMRYKRALRQLSKPTLWIYFVAITMVTAFVVSKIQSQDLTNGLMVGIQMNFRAITIILGFSVLGTELYNPKIRAFFLKTSFKQLPLALELSFESLPRMIAMIPELKVIVKNPVSIFYQIISQIDFRLAELKHLPSRKIFIISGAVGEGKTTQIAKIVEFLKTQNISIGGILSPRIMENDTTIGYDVLDIATNKRERFLTITKDPDQRSIGNYAILPSGLQAGLAALSAEINSRHKVVVIDEVGKLELDNKGWANSLNELLDHSNLHLIWSVRNTFIEQVIQKWNLQDYTIYHLSEGENPQIGQAIAEQINGQVPTPI